MKKRFLVSLIAIVMLVSCASGCGGSSVSSAAGSDPAASQDESSAAVSSEGASSEDTSSKSGNKTVLTFWNGFTSTDGDVLTEIVNTYNKENDKNVEIQMDIMPWDEFNQKLPAAIATGDAPDFVLCSNGYYPSYIKANSFQDMSGYWDYKSNYEGSAPKDDFSESVLEMLTYNDTLIGIPMQVVTHYFFWDKDLYKKAGLDPDTPPASMEEIAENAALLTDFSSNQYGFLIPTDNNVTAQYVMFAFGGDYCNADETEATFNSPENAKAFEWLYDVYVTKGASPTDSDDNTYISGQLAQFINGPWIIKGLRENDINFGVCEVPAAKGNETRSAGIGVGFSVPKTTSDENKELVYDFISYWNTTSNCAKWTEECGTPSYLDSTNALPEIKDDAITSVLSSPLANAQVVMRKTGVSITAQTCLYPALEDIFAGSDIQSTLDTYNEALQKLLDENK